MTDCYCELFLLFVVTYDCMFVVPGLSVPELRLFAVVEHDVSVSICSASKGIKHCNSSVCLSDICRIKP